MPLPPDEAADALHAIESAAAHSAAAYRYRAAAPHLILWGAIWIAGYTAVFFQVPPDRVWLPLAGGGALASYWINARGVAAEARGYGRRYGLTALAVSLFCTALFNILPPQNGNQVAALFPLLVGFWYVMLGIWGKGGRMLLLGAFIGALTVAGYFALPHYFTLWMAGVGGGGLLLGGFWLRRI